MECDVAIIGSGFGGSLTALLCERIGLAPVLIERGTHPRFTIGESSTPLADLILAELVQRYGLPRLKPLTKYGTWRRAYPEVACGLKRGFSYFHHRANEPFRPQADHANELLVAASPTDELGDTHWFRADVDHFFVKEVQQQGIPYMDQTDIREIQSGDTMRITATRDGQEIEIKTPLIIDASGQGVVLSSALGIDTNTLGIRVNSRTVYGHFENVRPWEQVYESAVPGGAGSSHHPFGCDDAALHHVFEGGWMWVLRFNNGITSAGFVLDGTRNIFDWDWDAASAADAWSLMLRRFPSIAAQFEQAAPIRPLVKTGRLQRLVSRLAGPNWVMLPYTAGFLDPLHSPGNAFTLLGIERLIRILSEAKNSVERGQRFAAYEKAIRRDVDVLDMIIHGCFLSFGRFELMTAFSMFYFAGAHMSEHRRRDGIAQPDEGFLMSHDPGFVEAVRQGYVRVGELARKPRVSTQETREFATEVGRLIAPNNLAGLCDPTKRNMYPFC